MKVDEFVEGFKKARDKVEFCKKHIVTTYLPFERKNAVCRTIIDSSMYREVNGKKMFYVDSVVKYELFVLTLIREYTDIELSTDGSQLLAEFNEIEKIDATVAITEAIGLDAGSIGRVLEMMVDDEFQNNSLEAKLDAKFGALMMAGEQIMGAIDETKNNASSK